MRVLQRVSDGVRAARGARRVVRRARRALHVGPLLRRGARRRGELAHLAHTAGLRTSYAFMYVSTPNPGFPKLSFCLSSHS